ncbi:MAG: hypothetical protein ABR613_00455 [Actinomycetota bacterium]
MKLKAMLVAGALAAGLLGAAAPASASASAAPAHPCHEYHPLHQPVEWTICMWYYLTK